MTRLSAHRLEKHFGERTLFRDVTFDIDDRDHVGLVGDNGCGKTTLLRMLTGEVPCDGGEIVRAKDTTIGYMEQHVGKASERTLLDEVLEVFRPIMAVEHALNEVNDRLLGKQAGDAALIDRQHRLQEQLEAMGGLYYRSRARATLLGLGFSEAALEQTMGSLSGGQRSKAAMARLLLSDSRVLLLDEPTNHLDIASVEWLEEFLRGYGGAFLVISHDRYFLDRVTSRTLELSQGRLYATNGGYSVHREARERERAVQEKHYKTASREIRRIEDNITLLKQWNREKSIRTAESKQKMVERLKDQLETPETEADTIHFDFTASMTSGNEVLTAEQVSMGFGDTPLFHDVSFHLRRGERTFLLGPNGCGKTTLLNLLCGRLTAWHGSVRLGAKVSIGYYDQTQANLDPAKTPLEELWDAYPAMTQTELRNALAAFLFRGDDVFRKVGLLSGGERARLLLLKLMLARDNLLLLDEPTNHLDIASREALEQALFGYDGTLFIVSHDRYFINRMADKVLRLTAEGCETFPGNYDAYMAKLQEKTAGEVVKTAASAAEKTAPVRENDYRLRKEQESARRRLATRVRRCEEAITQAEQEIAALHAQLESPEVAADYARVLELSEKLAQQNVLLDAHMADWEQAQAEAEEAGCEL